MKQEKERNADRTSQDPQTKMKAYVKENEMKEILTYVTDFMR